MNKGDEKANVPAAAKASRPPMPGRPSASRSGAQSRRRQRIAAVGVLALVAVGLLVSRVAGGAADPPARLDLRLEDRTFATVRIREEGRPLTQRAVEAEIPASVVVTKGRVRKRYRIDRKRTVVALTRAKGGAVVPPARLTAVSIRAPTVAQRLRNNCETAALEVLLATAGVRVDQMTLQSRLRRSGPPDPAGVDPQRTWGDPAAGYVGRADGTGPAGGFGVYPAPLAELAARWDRKLDPVTGASPAKIYAHLREGHAVEAWVGLDDGPYRSWTTPSGTPIRVNLNEHTIVLTGIREDGALEVVNVLGGTREVWSRARFERGFELLGGRALAV